MKLITYLAFTLLSIVIQFCVMEFIKSQPNKSLVSFNETSPKKYLNDVLKEFNQRPHALYYRAHVSKLIEKKNNLQTQTFNNSTLATSTENSTILTTTLDVLWYDENISTTEDSVTAETLFTILEYDNVTEISLFDKKNNSSPKTKIEPKRTTNSNCNCNLLFEICDYNCCCDGDCKETEIAMFADCTHKNGNQRDKHIDLCYSKDFTHSVDYESNSGLFCIAKSNLPDKRNKNRYKSGLTVSKDYFKWHSSNIMNPVKEFSRMSYKYGDPIWILKNESLYYLDFPTQFTNIYCNSRKRFKFLKNEHVVCSIKLVDLEIFHILNNLKDVSVISTTEKSLNATTLNCSTLHCTAWTIIICDGSICATYNESLHNPICTETICHGIALKLEYIFYYYESKIVNATIKLHTQKVDPKVPFLTQEVYINFLITNISVDKIVHFSGNPGYISDLPVIASFTKSNHTINFYNNSLKQEKYLAYVVNDKGICTLSNYTHNLILFGHNKRTKCKFSVGKNLSISDIKSCNIIQNDINQLLGLSRLAVVSPYGNPLELKDEHWLNLQMNTFEGSMFGQIDTKNQMHCINLITGVSYIFTFADVSDVETKTENKILNVQVIVARRNVTFNSDEPSTILTMDTIFIDATKPSVDEYAGGPHLNIHLPNDFFFPFPSNKSYAHIYNSYIILCIICVTLYFSK